MSRKVLSIDPLIFTISDFIGEEICNHFIELSKSGLKDSLVSDATSGKISNGRTSQNTWLAHDVDEQTFKVARAIASEVGFPLEHAEKFQVVYYDTGGEYRSHYDSWVNDGSEKTRRCMAKGGARLCTALVYLNDVPEGGETQFTKFKISVKPERGKLLVFHNTISGTNERHPNSEHAALPVKCGEKYVFNLWFRERSGESKMNTFVRDYEDFLGLVEEGKITRYFREKGTFSYTFRGDYPLFVETALNYIHHRQSFISRLNEISTQFSGLNYIEDVIPKEMLEIVQNYYEKTFKAYPFGDRQSQRFKCRNEPLSRMLHVELHPLIERIVGDALIPTYTYVSFYVHGSNLPPHTDNPDCEFTVSLVIDFDENWKIFIDSTKQPKKHKGRYGDFEPSETCQGILCGVGSCVLFDGTDHVHFRENFPGTFYRVLLLHYRRRL